ncbi:MAG TPA: HipA domain-containing protein [Melioribacteraceae bacterium]|nr:HipA domain-containing protein [Melioribacteraceae bacterium]
MNRCPLTYEIIDSGFYSTKGLKKINSRLTDISILNYSKEELLKEAAILSEKLSIEGVQPKLSAILSVAEKTFKFVDKNGLFIIKPQQLLFKHVPENEDLIMRLAETIKIEVPLHGLIYDKNMELHYFIKRFDRVKRDKKYAVEDFAQLSGKNRNTKYNSSMEKVCDILDKFCSFPAIEKIKLFKLTLFNYIVGNEDMHLKNFSILIKDDIVSLSPAYDLLSTAIILQQTKEEIALPINGKKNNLTKKDLIDYFGNKCLKLNDKIVNKVLYEIKSALPLWKKNIENSFLPDNYKQFLNIIIENRLNKLGVL